MTEMPPAGPLLFCSTVCPLPTGAGELLLYRHFLRLRSRSLIFVVPKEKQYGQLMKAKPLVPISPFSGGLYRLRRGPFYRIADRILAQSLEKKFNEAFCDLAPAAVLSVFIPDIYLTAAASFARSHQLPLVLFCHDDYENFVPRSYRPVLRRIYRQAAGRLCVSEPMLQEFQRRYGVQGTLLYPIPSKPASPPVPQNEEEPLRIGIAGSIQPGYEEAILNLADALGRAGGQLLIASGVSRKAYLKIWQHPVVEDLGEVPSEQIVELFRSLRVNVLAAIQSYLPQDKLSHRTNFPSKLTEYSTFGLPLLVVAPEYASAVSWLRRHPGAAVVVHSKNHLPDALYQLSSASARFSRAGAFRKAAADFDPEKLQDIFEKALETSIAMRSQNDSVSSARV